MLTQLAYYYAKIQVIH